MDIRQNTSSNINMDFVLQQFDIFDNDKLQNSSKYNTAKNYLEKQLSAHNLEIKRNHLTVIYNVFDKSNIKWKFKSFLKMMLYKETDYMMITLDNQ
jgi:hypothetical protein